MAGALALAVWVALAGHGAPWLGLLSSAEIRPGAELAIFEGPEARAAPPAHEARAAGSDRALDAVLWVEADAPPGFTDRLRGQLSDLRWRVRVGAGAPLGPGEARADLDALDADLSVRLSLADGRRFRRRLAGMGLSPAGLEAAAVAVRSALVAIDEGFAPDMVAEPDPLSPWGFRVGARLETWGLDPVPGLEVGALVRLRAWALGLDVTARVPAQLEDGLTRLRVGRYEVVAGVRLDAPLTGVLAAGGGVGAGLVLWHRETTALTPEVAARPPGLIAGAVARAQLGVLLRLGRGVLLALSGGVDALVRAPQLTYRVVEPGGGLRTEVLAEPWPVQPFATLGVRIDPLLEIAD